MSKNRVAAYIDTPSARLRIETEDGLPPFLGNGDRLVSLETIAEGTMTPDMTAALEAEGDYTLFGTYEGSAQLSFHMDNAGMEWLTEYVKGGEISIKANG